MQVFVHIGGKNYGPYSVEQLRQYVKAGNFKVDQSACFDGRNWVKISEVPGFSVGAVMQGAGPQPVGQTVPKKKQKMRTRKLLVVCFCVVAVLSLVVLSIAWVADSLFGGKGKTSEVKPVDLFVLSPDQVVDVYDGDTFKIDLPSMHPIFGDDLSIRVFGIDTPEMRGTSNEIKALAIQARELTEKILEEAEKIELKNPQRGKYFRIVSEVLIDGKSLADILKSKGLAKDYDGEGARPEW